MIGKDITITHRESVENLSEFLELFRKRFDKNEKLIIEEIKKGKRDAWIMAIVSAIISGLIGFMIGRISSILGF